MVQEIAFEHGRISNFQGLVTLTIDWVILHHSSTSTYTLNFIEIKETFCAQTGGRTFETHFIRSTQKSRPKNKTRVTESSQRNHVTDHKGATHDHNLTKCDSIFKTP